MVEAEYRFNRVEQITVKHELGGRPVKVSDFSHTIKQLLSCAMNIGLSGAVNDSRTDCP